MFWKTAATTERLFEAEARLPDWFWYRGCYSYCARLGPGCVQVTTQYPVVRRPTLATDEETVRCVFVAQNRLLTTRDSFRKFILSARACRLIPRKFQEGISMKECKNVL